MREEPQKMKSLRITMICLVFFVTCACAQTNQKSDSAGQTKTKLELFQARTGVVIIRGFSTIGTITARYNASAEVESKEFIEASSGAKAYGITIQVKNSGDYKRESTSYIDYDEIDSLLKGIDYIAKMQGSVTKLANFQADYRTKGALEISTFNVDKEILASVSSRSSSEATAYFELPQLAQLRDLIVKAKLALDAIR